MSSRPQHQARKSRKASKYKPRFENPVPLPSIDDFRLDHILTKVLPTETASVAASLSRVSDNYQKDLKGEIRKALAIEQRIQNKNISAVKRAHGLGKQWHEKQRKVTKAVPPNGDKGKNMNMNSVQNTKLGAEIDHLLVLATDVSSNVRSLALRMADLSNQTTGSSMPDPAKYPYLSRLMTSLKTAEDAGSSNPTQNGKNTNKFSNLSGSLLIDKGTSFMSAGNRKKGQLDSERLPNNSQFLSDNSEKASATHDSDTHKKPLNLAACAAPSNSFGSYPSESTSKTPETENLQNNKNVEVFANVNEFSEGIKGDAEMDSDAFELFMDTSIAKYRERKSEKYIGLESRPSKGKNQYTQSVSNPLRLLSAGSIGLNSHVVKSAPFFEASDSFKYSFLPRKSSATVRETPELSIHKKLRIKTMPSSESTGSEKTCNLCPPNPDFEPTIQGSTPKCTLSTAEHVNIDQQPELWKSQETQFGPEDDLDQIVGYSSTSDEGDSSDLDSLGSQIDETNQYYLSLQNTMSIKRRKDKPGEYREASYDAGRKSTPKHSPSHRVLQPKHSILKLRKPKKELEENGVFKNNDMLENSILRDNDMSKTNLLSEAQRFSVDSSTDPISSKYTASPRASFINECVVSGTILHGSDDISPGGDKGQIVEEGVEESASVKSENSSVPNRHGSDDHSQAIGKLKSLMI